MGIRIGTPNYLGERVVFDDYGNEIAKLCEEDMHGDIPVKDKYGKIIGSIRGGYALGELLLVNETGKIIGSIGDTDLIKDSFGNPAAGSIVSTDMFGDTNISGSADRLFANDDNPSEEIPASPSYTNESFNGSNQYSGNTSNPIGNFVSAVDNVTAGMLPSSITGRREFIEAWVPELKQARLGEERKREEKRRKEEYERDPIGYIRKNFQFFQKYELEDYVEALREMEAKGNREARALAEECKRRIAEKEEKDRKDSIMVKATTEALIKKTMERMAINQSRIDVKSIFECSYMADSWTDFADKTEERIENLGLDTTLNAIVEEARKRAKELKQQFWWGEEGLCMYCGGKLGFFKKKCKRCGKCNEHNRASCVVPHIEDISDCKYE